MDAILTAVKYLTFALVHCLRLLFGNKYSYEAHKYAIKFNEIITQVILVNRIMQSVVTLCTHGKNPLELDGKL